MRHIILSLKLLLYAYLAYLVYVLAAEYDPARPGFQPPLLLFVVDWVNLFIHEAGHLFFRIFGQFVHVLGGSLTQVLLPAALIYVTWRESPRGIGLPLFWTGESLVNVSVYVRDAPYQKLHLIARGLIHDWHWLLDGDPDASGIIGGALFGFGLLLCAAAVAAGIWFAVLTYREAKDLDQDPLLIPQPTGKRDPAARRARGAQKNMPVNFDKT